VIAEIIRSIWGKAKVKTKNQFTLRYFLRSSSNIIWMIRENETDGACGTHGGEEKCVQNFGEETLSKETA